MFSSPQVEASWACLSAPCQGALGSCRLQRRLLTFPSVLFLALPRGAEGVLVVVEDRVSLPQGCSYEVYAVSYSFGATTPKSAKPNA